MATVSSDQRLKVFDLNDEGGWILSDSVRAHDSSINKVWLSPSRSEGKDALTERVKKKVVWGPPEHGQILATCSYDRTVRIWEEQEMGMPLPPPQFISYSLTNIYIQN
jgi:nucleoporin SEH1